MGFNLDFFFDTKINVQVKKNKNKENRWVSEKKILLSRVLFDGLKFPQVK